MHFRAPSLLLLATFALAGCGHWEREERAVLERDAGARLHKAFWLHEAQFADRPRTNLAAIFEDLKMKYPSDLHHRLRRYGQEAGFTNSVFERYVFPTRRISNQLFKGEIILLSAKPYSNEVGQRVRIVLARSGSGYEGWSFNEFEEEQIQQTFKEAGMEMPDPNVLPFPLPQGLEEEHKVSLLSTARGFFKKIAYYYGPGEFFWLPILLIFVALLLAFSVIFVVWFMRRSRRE